MTTYAAFLRGIGPTNPNMRNEKLKGAFQALGFSNVQAVISSGNIIFTSSSKSISKMESTVEKGIEKQLGFKSAVFIRSEKELADLLAKDPFKGKEHGRKTYLIITFLKNEPREVFNIVDVSKQKTPEFMRAIEKKYGKENTTRTLKTVQRILAKMDA